MCETASLVASEGLSVSLGMASERLMLSLGMASEGLILSLGGCMDTLLRGLSYWELFGVSYSSVGGGGWDILLPLGMSYGSIGLGTSYEPYRAALVACVVVYVECVRVTLQLFMNH